MNYKGNKNSNWKGGLPKCRVCGKRLTVHHSTRCRACSLKDPIVIDKFRKQQMGSGNMNYKGGITPLAHAIRDLSQSLQWRDEVFAKSDYKCVDCGSKGYLEAHHIRPFTKLFKDFINLYNQFSVIDDRETLVRLAMTYKPFFDVSNGKTLCEPCHEKYRVEAKRDTHLTSDGFSVRQITSSEACKSFDQTL